MALNRYVRTADTQLRVELDPLFRGEATPFSSWPAPGLPQDAPGVYTIWRGTEFIYAGMSGNLFERLRSHASGRRAGDQFCVYVCDRLVVPGLPKVDLEALAAGRLSLDSKTCDFIQSATGDIGNALTGDMGDASHAATSPSSGCAV
jgi:hypothetical protein